ncbi:hypothetical protein AK812_SmicGene16563 [Symbiodinium microadriaticum]|uniref:Uncharacterized protein n=1 Tax=Symbiodinium microadriaticum TaxID=2951 RepID=A0A1Q9DZZ8_SYMMI|nr:hypothetical protein AK812_SmicGene16563 [Symbiodinium microadriaticum]CAE7648100.1 unnamed protein product [Symbiodinium microadriaticum]
MRRWFSMPWADEKVESSLSAICFGHVFQENLLQSTEGENVLVDLDKDEQVLVLRQQLGESTEEDAAATEEVEAKVAEPTAA